MSVATAKQICCVAIGSMLAIAVIIGAFVGLAWPALVLMAWLSLCLFGKRTMLDAATRLVRELRWLWPANRR
jgi:hypothetical protein